MRSILGFHTILKTLGELQMKTTEYIYNLQEKANKAAQDYNCKYKPLTHGLLNGLTRADVQCIRQRPVEDIDSPINKNNLGKILCQGCFNIHIRFK